MKSIKLIFSKIFTLSNKLKREVSKLNYNLYNIRILILKLDKELEYIKINDNNNLQYNIDKIIINIQNLHTALSETEKMLHKQYTAQLQVETNDKTNSNRIHSSKL